MKRMPTILLPLALSVAVALAPSMLGAQQGSRVPAMIGKGKVLAYESEGGVPLPGVDDVEALVDGLFALAARRVADLPLSLDPRAANPDFTVDFTFARDEDGGSLFCVLSLREAKGKKDKKEVGRSTIILSSVAEIGIRVPAALPALWARAFLKPDRSEDPLPISQLDAGLLAKALGSYDQILPLDMAMGPGGRLYLPVYDKIAVIEPDFRFVKGMAADPKGSTVYPYKLGVTATGTIVFQTSVPGELLRLDPGSEAALRASTGLRSQGRMAVLPDGSAVMDDYGSSPARLVRDRRSETVASSVIFPPGPSLAADQEGCIWTWDQTSQSARIYSSEGRLLADIPALSGDFDVFYPSIILPLSGGGFILANASGFRRYDATGQERSALDGLRAPADPDAVLSINAIAADPATCSVFILDMVKKTVVRYLDTGWLRERGSAGAMPAGVLEAAQRLRADPDSERAVVGLVKAWDAAGAQEAAYSLARAFLARGESKELEGLERAYSRAFEKASCLIKARQARDILDRLGPESAAGAGTLALQAFEAYLAMEPSDMDMRRMMEELRERLRGPSGMGRPRKELFTIVSARLDDLFPARSPLYREKAPASIVLRAAPGARLDDLRLSLMIDGYMDAPSEVRLDAGLDAGEELRIDLPILLSPAVFGLTEDLAVRARVVVEARSGQDWDARNLGLDARILKRSAISWEDSAALASFVTPHDSAVSSFAARAQSAAQGDWLGRPFSRALAVLEAMGQEGILYTPDPASPVGRAGEIDTVRYPRQTLELRSGDCDDTTALSLSLLESVGIPCAILTTPSHVLFAFDSGQDPLLSWLYSGGGLDCVREAGALWIPIESTILSKGFVAAWKEGWRLWSSNEGRREIIPLARARSIYPAVSPAEGSFVPVPPDQAGLKRRVEAAKADLESLILRARVAELEGASVAGDIASRHRALNKLAILRSMIGNAAAAEKALRDSLALGPGSSQSAANLSILLESQGRTKEALAVLDEGLAANPSSAVLKRLRAERSASASPQGASATAGGGGQGPVAGGAGQTGLAAIGAAEGTRGAPAAVAPRWILEE